MVVMATMTPDDGGPRSWTEKLPIVTGRQREADRDDRARTAFQELPDEIISQILRTADPNVFASLILLNSRWRRVSQEAHLYGLQLSRCLSYSLSHKPFPPDSMDNGRLPELRRLFAKEVKRNLFAAYLRPSQTVIKIISNSISSSSAPGGEGIQFASSPKGHHLLAYNSSRIYVISTTGPGIQVERELKILRRPAATCINDRGSTLAVLLTDMQVDMYDLLQSPPKRTQSIILDHSPRAIALSPCGSILAAAYEGGIEVSSLKSSALDTDRRAVKCDAVDALAFSFDGTQILGTTSHSSQPNTVILTAPYYDPGNLMADDDMSALWTTSILFPNSSRDCSHAVLIQNGRQEEAGWTFTYDRSFETFRAVRIEDLRNGTTYFTGPSPASQAKLIPCTLPAASYNGELVSAGFQGKEIWLYGVPEDLDAVADYSSSSGADNGVSGNGLNRRNSGPSVRSPSRLPENMETARVPQWQILCDKLRNTFVGGSKITELDGVHMVKWVADFGNSSLKERLLVAARGVMPPKPITEEDGIDFVDGGRLILVDFDYGLEDGQMTELCIEVGAKEPEVLEEETRDIEAEVAIVRRRTVAQKRGGPGAGSRTAVIRSSTTATRPPPPVPALPLHLQTSGADDADDDPLLPRRIGAVLRRLEPQGAGITEGAGTESVLEEQEALDAPYSHASPRSGTTLRRAATAAAVNRRLHPEAAPAGQIEYRRADGRREHPHESDADNWVPPPPPYQKEDPVDLPAFLRHRVAGGEGSAPVPPVPDIPAALRGTGTQTVQPALQPGVRSVSGPEQPVRSHSTIPFRQSQALVQPPMPMPGPGTAPTQTPGSGANARPTTSRSRAGYFDGDNIYDVSPPASPTASALPGVACVSRPTRAVSNDTVVSHTTESSVSPGSPLSQHAPPPSTAPVPVPRIQTIAASPERTTAPALDLHITSPSMSSVINNWPNASPQAPLPKPRPLSNAQTWSNPADTATADMYPTGYPYSAPPTDQSPDDSFALALPPAPSADQLARLSTRAAGLPPRRLSGGFQLNRVPVGGRAPGDYGPRRSSLQQPPPVQPQPQQVYESQYQQDFHQEFQQQSQQWSPQPQQSYPQQSSYLSSSSYQSSPSFHHPQPRRSEPPPVEDTPLIVSTPRGISGAFDPPDRRTSGRGRPDPQIIAPIPRHPRSSSAQAAVLRPTVDRLETVYSIASAHSVTAGPSSTYTNTALLMPSVTGSVRVSSLNRRQSRAERSAAKNIADAKKRGWNGRGKKGGKKKKTEFDVASSAAWTDVTTASNLSGFTGMFFTGGRSKKEKNKGITRSESAFDAAETDKERKGGKCVVM